MVLKNKKLNTPQWIGLKGFQQNNISHWGMVIKYKKLNTLQWIGLKGFQQNNISHWGNGNKI